MTKQEFDAILAQARLDLSNEDMYDAVNESIATIMAALGCNDEQ